MSGEPIMNVSHISELSQNNNKNISKEKDIEIEKTSEKKK